MAARQCRDGLSGSVTSTRGRHRGASLKGTAAASFAAVGHRVRVQIVGSYPRLPVTPARGSVDGASQELPTTTYAIATGGRVEFAFVPAVGETAGVEAGASLEQLTQGPSVG